MIKTVYLAKPRGFCAGVSRAILIVEKALEKYGSPIYVKHAIVHNIHVVEDLKKKGAIFVETIEEIPDGSTAIFSAHGSSPQEHEEAKKKNIKVIDAMCPLVGKVHLEAKTYAQKGCPIIYIGHKGHLEGLGVKGEVDRVRGKFHLIDSLEEAKAFSLDGQTPVAILTQTTLSVFETKDILKTLMQKFPQAILPPQKDICFATENRQEAVKLLGQKAEVVLVIGSQTSSNSNRLKEVAQSSGCKAYLIDDVSFVDSSWLDGMSTVGITSGASAPEYLVEQLIEYFKNLGVSDFQYIEAAKENLVFPLPKEL
ncbi:MAG: 4-hydroxy-3-methylbut-2-enyl diphosphate reductase [Candidatus Blackburnbacteria bacterium RIFCSPHIGHO2_02_FULL_39_13]|uniref:4-hydroxy-3-methylbut-2-enyl diphosphate reductase n=1 Tax=Candidatus Blackburnbacteria bacterium RIFCSPLOWO2_01_FULL_40_20 TaxID=1797519 RepID=A0A1G1VF40_9BACT|nr:MAG: 4-hydroxy-3-methylbut-2-enyl diphosphate reductase [Candidatus Blackburnbacteria bacterium RIFCSPHIGHO2_01_FULL_40_17]OGY10010.1 MAG: 4-hydroxy-3-methylbut-2-enyl diphosphate reductase [Candidatus Blackburnbacteria bacterium RIFCSPHIGHO2_02_FULL_39_13]OGY13947.1 MAG: 4-hydroxy-3-methylbut-2-enyl diphosphate reductase [Candidatus Blackburnbacteria bacterium RIFCSPLOWO2_01_FULL_40_20]